MHPHIINGTKTRKKNIGRRLYSRFLGTGPVPHTASKKRPIDFLRLRSYISRYRLIALSRSASIIRVEPSKVSLHLHPPWLSRHYQQLASYASSSRKLFQFWRCHSDIVHGAGYGCKFFGLIIVVVVVVIVIVIIMTQPPRRAVEDGASLLETFLVVVATVELWEAEEAAQAAAFLSLRLVATEARFADCTGGRMWSSTLLKRKGRES